MERATATEATGACQPDRQASEPPHRQPQFSKSAYATDLNLAAPFVPQTVADEELTRQLQQQEDESPSDRAPDDDGRQTVAPEAWSRCWCSYYGSTVRMTATRQLTKDNVEALESHSMSIADCGADMCMQCFSPSTVCGKLTQDRDGQWYCSRCWCNYCGSTVRMQQPGSSQRIMLRHWNLTVRALPIVMLNRLLNLHQPLTLSQHQHIQLSARTTALIDKKNAASICVTSRKL